MEQSTQTPSRGEFSPFCTTGSSMYSNLDNATLSPRHCYPFLPSKTHLGFQPSKVKGHSSSMRRSALLRRPQVAENKHSPRKRIENDLKMLKGIPVRKPGFSESKNGYRAPHSPPSGGMEPRPIEDHMDPPALVVRSKTITLGAHRKTDRPPHRQQSSSASNRRRCDACSVELVRRWLKSQGGAKTDRGGPAILEGQENGSMESSSADDVTMAYTYYMPMQLVAQLDEEEKSTPRDAAAITTVSVPKKGRLKLTGLSCELNNPDFYDNKREETNLKLQQKLYREELLGPDLPNTTLDLYRGTLLRNKNIRKQIKQGEQMLEQKEEAMKHRKPWQEPDDQQLEDLIGQLLHYDMPEVPTINKNFQTFAGIPTLFPSPSDQQLMERQNNIINVDNSKSSNDNNHNNNSLSTVNKNNTGIDNDKANNFEPSHDQFLYHKPLSRRLKSRSAQERHLILDLDLEANPHTSQSPRSLNVRVPQASAGPNSARTTRDAVRQEAGLVNGIHSDWLLPWEHCDSLHSVLTHAQKITLGRANIQQK